MVPQLSLGKCGLPQNVWPTNS
uniref:Uncharacterized protein n=1 Tax=Arundo donax TaxID=35708 RepID=A0A0A9BJG7_ARUDO